MATRRGLSLLALLAVAVLLLADVAAAAKNGTETADSGNTKKKHPPPPPKRGARKRPPPPPAASTAAAAAAPSPAQQAAAAPAPAPAAEASPPPPPPAVCTGDAAKSCKTFKLVFKLLGPTELNATEQQGVMAAVNSFADPVTYVFRAQRYSEPGQLPDMAKGKYTAVDPPPPPSPPPSPSPPPPPKKRGGQQGSSAVAGSGAAADAGTGSRRLLLEAAAAAGGGWSGRRLLATSDTGSEWYPEGAQTKPLNADGVFVFADGKSPADNVGLQRVLAEASASGQLCTAIKKNGVRCDGTTILYQGTGKPVFVQGSTGAVPADTASSSSSSSSSSSGGLSVGAIVGIAVGSAVALAALGMAIHMFVSCRRERRIDRAAKLRVMSRKYSGGGGGGGGAAGATPEGGESRWRQMYAQRMEESMRRAEEASSRQRAAADSPSFVERLDKEFAAEAASAAAGTPQPQLSSSTSSKKSFGRAFSIGRSPQTPEPDVEKEESWHEQSLMAGSEVSSPPPSMSGSAKRSGSFKKLFGKK